MAFQYSAGLCSTLTILFITGKLKCQEIGPRNISRMEGEKDVFISCPFTGQYLPAWEINGKLYELFQLPDVFIPASRGILIPVIDVSLNGTTFQCVYPTGSGFHVEESSVGKLTVTPSRYAWVTQTPPSLPSFIYIDHQHTVFEKYTKMISFKHTQDPTCNNYKLQSKLDCEDESTILNTWLINNASTTINSIDLVNHKSQKLVYFNIFSENNQQDVCGFMRINFQIKQQVVTQNLTASRTRSEEITIPTETEDTVYIVLPLPNSQSFDCPCAITFFYEQCTKLKNCSCINHTVFNTSINICNSTDGLKVKFENLTEAMNGSRLFFFQSYFCYSNGIPYRKYIASYEIMEVLPEEPMVDIMQDVNEVCVHLNDDQVKVNNYEITVYDITGEQTFHDKYFTSNKSSNCSSIGEAFSQAACQPFLVSVKANNVYGSTYRNVTVMTTTHQVPVCSCLERNVKVDASPKPDTDQITVVFFCSNLRYKSTVFFEAKVEENNTKSISCETVNSTQSVLFDKIDCSMHYNLSIIWMARNEIAMGAECRIDEQYDISVSCFDSNIIIIGSTTGAAALLVILIILTATVVICVIHHKKRIKEYDELDGQSINDKKDKN